MAFDKSLAFLNTLDISSADPLEALAKKLLEDEDSYERASQALRRRFSRGASEVEGMDRNERLTKIRRDKKGGKYKYFIMGKDGMWTSPDERIWVVAMYALWQNNKNK
jgi:hypothetical protein